MGSIYENAPIVVYPEILRKILLDKINNLGAKYDLVNIEKISNTSAFYFLDISDRDIGFRTGKVINSEAIRDEISSIIEEFESLAKNKDFILLKNDTDGFMIFNIHQLSDIISLPDKRYNRIYVFVSEEAYEKLSIADRSFFMDIGLSETKKLIGILEEKGMYDILLKMGDIL